MEVISGHFHVMISDFFPCLREGQIYSVNDAKYNDWPPGLQRYIDNVRQGKGQTQILLSVVHVLTSGGPASHHHVWRGYYEPQTATETHV